MKLRIFTLSGYLDDEEQTLLKMNLNPPIYLDPNRQHYLDIIGVQTFYHIPNITEKNNLFVYGIDDSWERIEIPVGTYKADDLHTYLKTSINENDISGETLDIYLNNNTLESHLKCTYDVNFEEKHSIGQLLGFLK